MRDILRHFSFGFVVLFFAVSLCSALSSPICAQSEDGLPTVVSTTPDEGAEGVASDATISIVFSKPMNASSFSRETVKAVNPHDGDVFAGDIEYDNATYTMTFKPTGTEGEGGAPGEIAGPGFHYLANIEFTVSSFVEDVYGNQLDGQGIGHPSDFVLHFEVEKHPSDPIGLPVPLYCMMVIAVIVVVIIAVILTHRKKRREGKEAVEEEEVKDEVREDAGKADAGRGEGKGKKAG